MSSLGPTIWGAMAAGSTRAIMEWATWCKKGNTGLSARNIMKALWGWRKLLIPPPSDFSSHSSSPKLASCSRSGVQRRSTINVSASSQMAVPPSCARCSRSRVRRARSASIGVRPCNLSRRGRGTLSNSVSSRNWYSNPWAAHHCLTEVRHRLSQSLHGYSAD